MQVTLLFSNGSKPVRKKLLKSNKRRVSVPIMPDRLQPYYIKEKRLLQALFYSMLQRQLESQLEHLPLCP